MSLDAALSDRDVPIADLPAPAHVAHSMPPLAPYVLPIRSGGYAQRSTARSNVVAFAITAALHGAALIGFMMCRSPEIFVPPPAQPLVVTLLPLARAPAEVRRTDRQPKPARLKPRPALIRPIIRPIIPTVFSPVSASPDITPPAPQPASAPPTPAAAPANAARVSDAPGNARDSWEGRVLARLERFKRFPAVARSRRDQGVATVRFRLDRQGRVLSSSIAHSSGNAVLDQEALATLSRAEPLPPIPADRPDELELIVPVEFVLSAER